MQNCIYGENEKSCPRCVGTRCGQSQKAEKTNRFIPAEVSCAVREKLDNNGAAGTAAVGGEKADIRVENTGNVNGFFRLRPVSYYVDLNGDIAGTVASQNPNPTLKNGWIAGANHTHCFLYSVEPKHCANLFPSGRRSLQTAPRCIR